MNNLIRNGLNNTETFIKLYNLNHKITYLTLLFYQFVYLLDLTKEKQPKADILCSYIDFDNDKKFVTVIRHENGYHILKRFRFNEEIYHELDLAFDHNGPIIIDDALVSKFNELYKRGTRRLLI